jgi:methyl-accepting chemotaxis protein
VTQTAALIAASSFALLALAGVLALLRMARLMSESTRLISSLRERGDVLLERAQAAVDGAQAAVDRAGRQLDRAESVTASMDELGAGMSELTGQVTALAGFGKAIAASPVGKAGAVAYGVRHALGLRRASRLGNKALPGSVVERR